MNNQRMLIVANNQGMLMTSLKNMLGEHEIDAFFVAGDTKAVMDVESEYEAVLLYTDDELASNQQMLIYLRDKCLEENIPFFIIGDQPDIDDIEKVIPKNNIAKKYVRPVKVTEVAADIEQYLEENDRTNKKKILVVDDSGAMLRNVKGWLEDKYQVILANSGAMAIKYLSLNRPDLVLLDYEMPVADGRQVLEMMRSEVDFADIPVIFLTSKNDKESVSNVVKLRVEGYLLKTMKPDEIVKYVDDFFIKQKSLML